MAKRQHSSKRPQPKHKKSKKSRHDKRKRLQCRNAQRKKTTSAKVPHTPGSLGEALAALKKDHEFLMRGDVFTEDVINTWIAYKQANEVEALALRPHPYEFCLYYDM